jgi:hypothetical protein
VRSCGQNFSASVVESIIHALVVQGTMCTPLKNSLPIQSLPWPWPPARGLSKSLISQINCFIPRAKQASKQSKKACALLPNSDNPPHPATRSTLYSLSWANLGLFPSQASCLSTASFRLTLPPLLMVVPVTSSQLSLRQILTTWN